mmetsp:Transcript_16633/g.24599  ORF Transcript_16633/g.24599 Transcript_16633/m.24599 type:complete len:99 (-) Transcript_16633:1376-1672(-)
MISFSVLKATMESATIKTMREALKPTHDNNIARIRFTLAPPSSMCTKNSPPGRGANCINRFRGSKISSTQKKHAAKDTWTVRSNNLFCLNVCMNGLPR